MGKPLILIDLDKTLIDENFKLTEPAALSQIQKMQKAGWTIGLNSDRPSPTLFSYRRQFRMNGPVVAEMGNAVFGADSSVLFENDNIARTIDELLQKFILKIRQQFSGVIIVIGDTPAILASFKHGFSASAEVFLIINGLRRFSFGFNTRRRSNVHFEIEPDLLKEASAIAIQLFREIFAKNPKAIVNYDEYGSCILHLPDAGKDHGVDILRTHEQYAPITIIGDSRADYTGDKSIVHCAVANAEESYKTVCQFVAKKTYSAGVQECLEWIEQIVPIKK